MYVWIHHKSLLFLYSFVLIENFVHSRRDWTHDDNITKSPRDIFNYLARRLYNQRSRFDPFWNQLIVAGYKDQQTYIIFLSSNTHTHTHTHTLSHTHTHSLSHKSYLFLFHCVLLCLFVSFHVLWSFLGYVDLHGTNYEDVTLATGYGSYLARPILRNVRQGRPNLSEEEARYVVMYTNFFSFLSCFIDTELYS
jgi:20S proteasome subunit beta 7